MGDNTHVPVQEYSTTHIMINNLVQVLPQSLLHVSEIVAVCCPSLVMGVEKVVYSSLVTV